MAEKSLKSILESVIGCGTVVATLLLMILFVLYQIWGHLGIIEGILKGGGG